MGDRNRENRRRKKLAKQKLKKKGNSRPGKDLRTQATAPSNPKSGIAWPAGPCWLSDGWHERGAEIQVVMTRVDSHGSAMAGLFEIDLRKAGIRKADLLGGLQSEQLPSLAAKVSDDLGGIAMVEVSPAQAAAALVAGISLQGQGPLAETARDMLGDIDPAEAPIGMLTGLPESPRPERPEGWFSKLVGKLVGSP